MDNETGQNPFNQQPKEKLSDYIIDDIITEDEVVSDVVFNTEDNERISVEDIKICTEDDNKRLETPEQYMTNPSEINIDNKIDSNIYNTVNNEAYKPNIDDLPVSFSQTIPEEEIEVLTLDEEEPVKEEPTDDQMASDNLQQHYQKDEKRPIEKDKKPNNKIVILLVAVGSLLMMWYTTFAQPLASNSNQVKLQQNKAEDGSWEIDFTDMYQKTKVGSAVELSPPEHSSTTASFNVSLANPGDEITYDITIKNNGTLDAKVSSINVMPTNQESDVILYYVNGIEKDDELRAGETTHMTVTAKYNDSGPRGSGIVKSVKVIIQYEQL